MLGKGRFALFSLIQARAWGLQTTTVGCGLISYYFPDNEVDYMLHTITVQFSAP